MSLLALPVVRGEDRGRVYGMRSGTNGGIQARGYS